MWQHLAAAGLQPATATGPDPVTFTMGDLQGSVDLLCHELVRRFRADALLSTLFGSRIDYFEHFPRLDFRNFPTLKIMPGAITQDYGVGDEVRPVCPIDCVIGEDALDNTPVPYGAPTVRTLQSYLEQLINNYGSFKVVVGSAGEIPTVRYGRPGPIAVFPDVDQTSGRVIWNTKVTWIFDLLDVASTQRNLFVSAAGG